jgi:4-hydroxybenzoate polyprenyltransferase
MRDFERYKLLNILSLDIVAGSVISALFFARIFNVKVLPAGLTALALTVWLIYTADHLLDAWSIKGEAATERHRFHQRYFTLLLVCVAVGVIVDTALLFYIRPQVFKWGVILSTIIATYLVIQRYLKFLKEPVIAVLYTCGVLLPSISVTTVHLDMYHWTIVIQFGILAFTNLLIFSWFDNEPDSKHNQHSFATFFGRRLTEWIIWVFIVTNFIIGMVMMNMNVKAELILTAMTVCLSLVFVFRSRLKKEDRYRFLGDSIFLFPVVYLV